jgi:AbiV family abortive infection protein
MAVSLNQLKVEELQEIYNLIYKNACELIEEAELLYNHQKYARSYLCAHIALEEFGKLPMLVTTALNVYNGLKVDWKDLNKRLRNHKTKTSLSYAMLMLMENAFRKYELGNEKEVNKDYIDKILLNNENLQEFKAFIESENLTIDLNEVFSAFKTKNLLEDFQIRTAISEMLNDYKNHSLYADFKEGEFLKPSDVIDEKRCRKRIMLALIQKKIVEMANIHNKGFKLFKFNESYFNILQSTILD